MAALIPKANKKRMERVKLEMRVQDIIPPDEEPVGRFLQLEDVSEFKAHRLTKAQKKLVAEGAKKIAVRRSSRAATQKTIEANKKLREQKLI